MATVEPEVQLIFNEAISRDSAESRQQYIEEACANRPQVRARVEALLSAHFEAGEFLGGHLEATEIHPLTEKSGDSIGPYKLLQQIGEGGMGVVYMAEQKEPVKRRVALKIIKPGMDTRQVIARFEAERQALAMMDHPNIAKVLDAGQTDSGRPYFVMELVNGLPVTSYCDEQHLTPTERLELFLPICQAVQHAHQKGIIHRDLKPSNIMVALYDGQAVPKIIDFGVAKATSQTLTEKTMFTELGQVVGTLEYMSPEQAQRNQLDIDTRSDIYSLGVVLYELLSGETPFDRERLRLAAYDEILRMIREEEPAKPSTKVSSSQSLPSIAANRRIEPAKLGNTIRGELDWIVMKAMDKDRKRRYDTVSKLAEDIGHYLSDEPVDACPPSALYRLQKLLRRNKIALFTASTVAAALLVATAVSLRQATIARQALKSEQNARQQAEEAEQRASTEATRSQQVALFLTDMLAAAGPEVARGRDATLLKEVLAQAERRIEAELKDEPAIRGDLWHTLGKTYQDMGEHEKAIEAFRRANKSYEAASMVPQAKYPLTLSRLGKSLAFIGELDSAERYAEQGVEMARSLGDQEILADCLVLRAQSFRTWNMAAEEAAAILQEALEIYRVLDNRQTKEAECLHGLAGTRTFESRSLKLARRAYGIFSEEFGDDHPKTVDALWMVGQLLLIQGNPSQAEPVLRETLQKWETIYEKNHPLNHIVRIKLASSLALQDKWEEAHQQLEEAPTDMPPREHLFADLYYSNLFKYLLHYDQPQEAKAVIQRMETKLTEIQATYGPDHMTTQLYQKWLKEMHSRMTAADAALDLPDEEKLAAATFSSVILPTPGEHAAKISDIESKEKVERIRVSID